MIKKTLFDQKTNLGGGQKSVKNPTPLPLLYYYIKKWSPVFFSWKSIFAFSRCHYNFLHERLFQTRQNFFATPKIGTPPDFFFKKRVFQERTLVRGGSPPVFGGQKTRFWGPAGGGGQKRGQKREIWEGRGGTPPPTGVKNRAKHPCFGGSQGCHRPKHRKV